MGSLKVSLPTLTTLTRALFYRTDCTRRSKFLMHTLSDSRKYDKKPTINCLQINKENSRTEMVGSRSKNGRFKKCYLIKWTILPVSKSMVKYFGACFYIQDASLVSGLNWSKIAGNGRPMGILDSSKLLKLSGWNSNGVLKQSPNDHFITTRSS